MAAAPLRPPRPVQRFDELLDAAFDHLRGRRVADGLAYGASALGDHGLLWLLAAAGRAARGGPHRAAAVRALVFTGAVTPLVNAGLKAAIGRRRPQAHRRHPFPIRVPRTASFPSGHALAAWCAAVLLAEDDPAAGCYYAAAVLVSASRVHVRMHHASDVVAGALVGAALGLAGRRLIPLARPGGMPAAQARLAMA